MSLILLPERTFSDLIYGFIMIIVSSLVLDAVLVGGRNSVQVLVFSRNYEQIADYVIKEMERGVTALEGVGWFTKQEKKVLLLLMQQKEVHNFTRVVKKLDKTAFMSISPASNVYGEGFEEIKVGLKLHDGKKK